jgi:hypothetical protein
MSESLLSKCVALLQRDDIKQEIKQVLSPTINEVLVQIYPYIYLSLIFVILSFLLHLGIFILLWRNKSILPKE